MLPPPLFPECNSWPAQLGAVPTQTVLPSSVLESLPCDPAEVDTPAGPDSLIFVTLESGVVLVNVTTLPEAAPLVQPLSVPLRRQFAGRAPPVEPLARPAKNAA